MPSPSSAAEDGSVMASWFSFSCAKPRSERSSLLEENLAAKAETQPSCVRCQSDESNLSDANASLLSEASTAPGIRDGSPPKRRTSFADQQGQPIEKMCACPAPPKACNHPTAIGLHSSSSSCPARRFYVPSRDDVAESMGEGDDDDDDDGDDIAMILDKLRRSDEDEEDEQTLQEWMRTQQEAARKTWGVKGDVASLAQYRRRQLLRYGHAQHVFDDEMSDEWNEHQVPGPASTSPAHSPPKNLAHRQPSPQPPPNRFLTDALGLWLQASLLVGGRLHDATQRRELVAALGSPSDDGAITRFFDPVYPSSALSRLPDDLLREDGDEIARSRESSVDQFDVFVDALDRRVGRAFSQLETLFMPERESSTSSRAAVSGRTRF